MTAKTDQSQHSSIVKNTSSYQPKPTFMASSPTDSPTTVDAIRAFAMHGDDQPSDDKPSTASDDTASPSEKNANKKGRRLLALEMIADEATTNSTIQTLRESLEQDLRDKHTAAAAKLSVLGSIRDRQDSDIRQVAVAVAQQQKSLQPAPKQSRQEELEEEEEAEEVDEMDVSSKYHGLSSGLGVSHSARSAPLEQMEPKRDARQSIKERLTSERKPNDEHQKAARNHSRMSQSLSVLQVDGDDDEDDDVADPSMCASTSHVPTRRWQVRADISKVSASRLQKSSYDENENEDGASNDNNDEVSICWTVPDSHSEEKEAIRKTEETKLSSEPPQTPNQTKPKSILKRTSMVVAVPPQTPLSTQSTHVAGNPTRSILHSLYDERKNMSLHNLSIDNTQSSISISPGGMQRRNTSTATPTTPKATPTTPRRSQRRSTSNRKLQEESLHASSQRHQDGAGSGGGGGRRLASTTRHQSARRLERRSQRSTSSTRLGVDRSLSDRSRLSHHGADSSNIASAPNDATKPPTFRRTVSTSSAVPTTPKKSMEKSSTRENPRRVSSTSAEGAITSPPQQRRARSRSRTRSSCNGRKGSSRSRTRRMGANKKSASQSDLSKMQRGGTAAEDELRSTPNRNKTTTRRSRQKSDRHLTKSRSDRHIGSSTSRRSRGDRNSIKANPDDQEFDQALVAFMSHAQSPEDSFSTLQTEKVVADATVLQFDPTVKHNVSVIVSPAPKKKQSVNTDKKDPAEDKTVTKKSPKKRSSTLLKMPLWGKKQQG